MTHREKQCQVLSHRKVRVHRQWGSLIMHQSQKYLAVEETTQQMHINTSGNHICLADSIEPNSSQFTSQMMLCPMEMPAPSPHLCIFSSCVTLDTVFPCPEVIQSCSTSAIYGHNVFSVFLQQMSQKTLFVTHTTYTPFSAWKYHSRSHNNTLSKTIAPGNWEINNKLSQKESGQREVPIAFWTTPWDEWRKKTDIWTLDYCLEKHCTVYL